MRRARYRLWRFVGNNDFIISRHRSIVSAINALPRTMHGIVIDSVTCAVVWASAPLR